MDMQQNWSPNRRDLLKSSLAAAGGLIIGFHLPASIAKANVPAALDFASAKLPNAFVRISADNVITLIINKLEMGQGVNTSLAQLIAEELECDWKQIRSESAPVDPVYNHTMFGTQMAGGSTSLSSSWEQLRKVGAMAREMLRSAAAKRWQVPLAECRAANGRIEHAKKGSLTYGELASAAAAEQAPSQLKLKDPKDYKIIGRSVPRVDAAAKVNGSAIFGLDIRVPGMVYAAIARPPYGAKLTGFDEKAARKITGVQDVIKLSSDKVAVVASNSWAALKGREALNVKWQLGSSPELSQDGLEQSFRSRLDQPGKEVKKVGQAQARVESAATRLEAVYEFPYLAHVCMEPLNCTISFDGKKAQIWSGHQMPTGDRAAASAVLGIPPEAIEVNTTYAGGSFGRRANKNSDYVVEASELAKVLKKPVKVFWTREDDTRGGYYRPLTMHKIKAGLDKKGQLTGWHHTIAGQSVMENSFLAGQVEKTGIDPLVVEGVNDTRYALTDFEVQLHLPKSPVPSLWWRAVGHTHTAYVMETFIDELALAAKQDPLQYRRQLLKNSPRHLAVLDLLAKHSAWGKAAPKGRAYGLAIHESFQSVVGHVVEVSLQGTDVKVHSVTSAVHCGTVVNPEGARAQVESAIVYGLSACLYEGLTLDRGQIVQGNFNDVPVLRQAEMPAVKVHFVASKEAPTGLGEPGLPPIAPAVANAIHRLNGQRLRVLPFKKSLEAKA
jgi:isoquinoline 1-oxidoreductase beta subunit